MVKRYFRNILERLALKFLMSAYLKLELCVWVCMCVVSVSLIGNVYI